MQMPGGSAPGGWAPDVWGGGSAGTLGSQRRALLSCNLDSWRVDPPRLGDGPLGAQRRDPHNTGTYTSEEWSAVLIPLELGWSS